MTKSKVEQLHILDLAAHELRFDGVELPINLGRGVTLRLTDDEETKAIHDYLGFPERSTLKFDDRYVCFQRGEGFEDESKVPLRVRHAFALLIDEIIFRAETVQMRRIDGKMVVGVRMTRANDLGANILEGGNFLTCKAVIVDNNCVNRLRKLVEFNINDDPFIKSFESAHHSLPKSEFRFVTYMSIVEGLICPEKETTRIRDNISTKMDYFYNFIWPKLNLTVGLARPKFRDGREIPNLKGAWNDLYKIRNQVAHGRGDTLLAAQPLKNSLDGLSVLDGVSRFEAADLLDHGVKSLLYWHLERPDERKAFASII